MTMISPSSGGGPVGGAPRLLARCAQGAIAAAAGASVFRAVALRARRPHPTDASANTSALASMVLVYVMTAAAVLFLVWFSRCRRNARLLTPGAAAGPDVWAVLAWLVPVVNLWAPRGLLLEVQHASGGAQGKSADDRLVNAWWVAWAAHGVIAAVSQTVPIDSLVLLVVSEALSVAAAVLAICVIQRITALQSTGLRPASPAEPLSRT
ncbi:DUF4328 domain-containing protein [Streptomyces sp. NPDC046931]|uniref:DUF4328 domain-containing protein n=1 Tax=Streptomyces sp. NPDC046931 TaxID=3154806 RepID=UPI0033F933D7